MFHITEVKYLKMYLNIQSSTYLANIVTAVFIVFILQYSTKEEIEQEDVS